MSKRLLIPSPDVFSGGSETGCSYWTSFLTCPKAAVLDKDTPSEIFHLKVGILFHKLMEIYYTGGQGDYVLQYSDGSEDPAWQETLRLFRHYRENYATDEFGKIVSVEESLKSEHNNTQNIYGVPVFTGTVDMVVELDDEACKRLLETRPELGLMFPGVYLVDHKTAKSRSKKHKESMLHRLQFFAYQMLYKEVHPDVEIQGMIANCVFKHTEAYWTPERSLSSYFIPPPNEKQEKFVRLTLSQCLKLRETLGPMRANSAMCFFGPGCRHYVGFGGECERV